MTAKHHGKAAILFKQKRGEKKLPNLLGGQTKCHERRNLKCEFEGLDDWVVGHLLKGHFPNWTFQRLPNWKLKKGRSQITFVLRKDRKCKFLGKVKLNFFICQILQNLNSFFLWSRLLMNCDNHCTHRNRGWVRSASHCLKFEGSAFVISVQRTKYLCHIFWLPDNMALDISASWLEKSSLEIIVCSKSLQILLANGNKQIWWHMCVVTRNSCNQHLCKMFCRSYVYHFKIHFLFNCIYIFFANRATPLSL